MKHTAIALTLGALMFTVATVNACGLTECQPHGGLTRPDLEEIIMGRPPHHEPKPETPKPEPTSAPVPPVGGDVPTQEEDTPPTPTVTPTAVPTPSVGLVPPVSTTVPPVQPTWVIPTQLPHAGN